MSAAVERRNVPAREARDRLAGVLGVHPGRLASIDHELAALLAFRLEQAQEAAELAQHDELTGVLTRAQGRGIFARELERSARSHERLSLLFIDFDGLKEVNDAFGHAIGDHLLRLVGETLADTLRPYDAAMRWGGDEFVVVLPDCDLDRARRIGERISQDFQSATRHSLTCGAAELLPGDDLASLVDRADAEMYEQKRARRRSREALEAGQLTQLPEEAHGSATEGGT